jgi:hypothetical protein
VENTLKDIRQRVILVVLFAFGTGMLCANTIADYRKAPTNFDGGHILVCAVFLLGTLFHSCIVWSKLKQLEPPYQLTTNIHATNAEKGE